ncbi:MAG: zinc ribbon domain-containing protein [Roseburia sp.]|nr:zinc ribbon domain-containing protein [Anaeroplasma bactoclasticum]MCM1196595.1 zinc ribbon domain-containing protein [Roseburia sp.]MCM1556035.1 zinc ribbon domain-containing protein [Anaeroplasma bactoclasticum]
MICKECGKENLENAKFCKACGKPLEIKNICPSCGVENKKEANYCKACGTSLNKKKIRNVTNSVFKIISLCMCGFIILYCFIASFTNFMDLDGLGKTLMDLIGNSTLTKKIDDTGLNLVQVIKNISNVDNSIIVQGIGAYAKAAYLVSNIVMLFGILTAVIGCGVVFIIAVVKSVRSGLKRQLPNLDRYSVLATGFLLAGLLIVSLNHFKINISFYETSISLGYGYGAFVLSAVCIGLIWMIGNPIVQIIIRRVEGCRTKEIRNRVFKIIETSSIVVLVFNVAISFAEIFVNYEGVNLNLIMSNLEYFKYAYCLAGITKQSQGSISSTQIQSLVMSTIMLVFMIVFVVISLIFFIKRGTKNKEEMPKASLCCGITFMLMAVSFLTLSCITASMILKDVTLLDMSEGTSFEEFAKILQSMISSNVIIFMVFSLLLLVVEIIWKVLDSNKKDFNYAFGN